MLFLSDQLQLSFFPNGDDLEIGTNKFEVSRGVDELKLIDGAVFAWNTMEFLGQKKNKLNISFGIKGSVDSDNNPAPSIF